MAGILGADETNFDEPCQLVAGEVHEQKPITLAADEVRTRGTVLGMVTASFEYKILNTAGADGTEVARAILAEDVDATGAAKETRAHFTGKYRLKDLVWPGSITDAQKNAAILDLQDRGIIVDEDFV